MATSSSGPNAPADLERLLADYPPDIADLVRRVRGAIVAAMPDLSERVYFGWRGIGFHHPVAGYLCAIFPSTEDVKIGFEHGHLLHDPDQLLEGTGKQVRYLRVLTWDHALSAVLTDFIDQAVRLR